MSLYRWQKECLKAWKNNDYRGIIHVVTGAGKTRFALSAIDELLCDHKDLVIRIVVPTIPLAWQWQEAILHHMSSEDLRPGFFGGGRRDDPNRRVMIYVINSARDYLSGHIRRDLALGYPVLLICDECHHYQSRENRRIFNFLTQEIMDSGKVFSLGLSATPFGTAHDRVLIRALGKEIYHYDFDDAVRDGVISPFTVCEVSASFLAEELFAYQELSDKISLALKKLYDMYPKLKGMAEAAFMKTIMSIAQEADMDPEDPAAAFLLLTYQRKEISNLAVSRIFCGLSLIERLDTSDRILVFCERISQAEEMTAVLRKKLGYGCDIYHSEMTKDARERVLDSFRNGSVRILVTCRCLDEGIDVPDANIGIVLSSSAIERQRIQRLGRIVRRSSGKDNACLYYIYIRESSDNAAYLKGLEDYACFSLRYYTADKEFSNEIYEYVAATLLHSAEEKGFTKEQCLELRACLMEGLVRADYLLPDQIQEKHKRQAEDRHRKNYWTVMKKVGAIFR